jgi:hypothetical protein
MSAGTGWNGPLEFGSSLTLWGQLKEAAVPVLTYWAWVLFAYASFCVAIVAGEGLKDAYILVIFGLGVVASVAVGQVAAFLRVRTWIMLSLGAASWTFFFVFLASGGAALMDNAVVAAVMTSIFFLGPVAWTGGLWSLETNRALWSAWLPLVFTVAAVIAWAEDHGALDTWLSGNKAGIWDLASLGFFVPSVGFLLLYLVSRETHRLAMWRRGPTAPLLPSRQERGVSRPRVTLLGLVLLAGLAIVIAGATAVIAPYLWRTGPDDGNGPHHTEAQDRNQADAKSRQGQGENPLDGVQMPEGAKQLIQKAGEAAKKASGTICSVLSILLIATLGALLAYRPLKRLVVVRHLRDPLWEVPPSHRIEQCWRMVEIALGDAGVDPQPGEDAAGLARRAAPVLRKLSPVEVHGLEDVAEVADRVRFGLGVGPDDVAVVERFSKWVLDTVWERLDDKAQLAAMYRGL